MIATPDSAKQLFQPFLFPCKDNKQPDVSKGLSWLQGSGKLTVRDTRKPLCGLDCGQAGLVVVDFDVYKESFKKSESAQSFYKECLRTCKFKVKTPSGGYHFFFRGSTKSFTPYPGVDIKSQGGYVCLYSDPAKGFENFKAFHQALPQWWFVSFGEETPGHERPLLRENKLKEHREFGPGQNNWAVPQRAGKAGSHKDFDAFENDLIDLMTKNRDNPKELKKHIKDYRQVFWRAVVWGTIPKKTKLKIQEIAEEGMKEVSYTETIQLTENDIKKPKAFIEDFLLDSEFNFVGGPTKLGKSRALLSMLSQELKEGQTGLILSTENDQETMMAPLLKELNAFTKFKFITDDAAKYFPKAAKDGPQKAEVFVSRIRQILLCNPCRCFLIDPLPRFFDWNNEVTVTTFIDGLRAIAKETKTCIIGIRNDGKAKEYEDVHKTKGSSALADIARQIIRSIHCHKRSALGKEITKGKENKKQKGFVLFTERSGLFKEVAFLFRMTVRKQKDFTVAVPVKVRELKESIDTIKYLCTRESGQTARQKVVEYMEKQNPKRATLDDLRDFFDDTINDQTLKNLLAGPGFDQKQVGGVTYYFPHVASKA